MPDVISGLVILGSLFLFLGSILGYCIPFYLDIFHQQYPWQMIDNAVLNSVGHSLPTWNPFMNLGCPLLADPQMQIYYPPALVYRFLPFPAAQGLYLTLHLVIAGAGMASFLRRQGLSLASVMLGAIGFAYGAHPALLIYNAPILAGYCWLPWIADAAWHVGASGSWPSVIWLALCFTWEILSGYPQYPIYGALMAIVCTVSSRREWGSVVPLCLAGVICFFLAAESLVPAISYIVMETNRGQSIDVNLLQLDVMPFTRLLGYLAPLGQLPSELGSPQNIRPMWVTLHFVGTPALVLAIARTAFSFREGHTKSALCLIGGGLFFGLLNAVPGSISLLHSVPVLNMMKHSGMWLAISDFGMLWLAALGMEDLAKSRELFPRHRVVSFTWGCAVAFLALGGGFYWLRRAAIGQGWFTAWTIASNLQWLIHPGFMMLLVAGTLSLAIKWRGSMVGALVAIVGLGYAELLVVSHILQPV